MRWALFLSLFVIGVLLVIYHRKINETINLRIGWAERFFGVGGTDTAYILFGLVAILLSFFIIFGWVDLGFQGINQFFGLQ